MLRVWVLTVAIAATVAPQLRADPQPTPGKAPPTQNSTRQALIAQRNALAQKAQALWRAGKLDSAIDVATRALAIERRLVGDDHPFVENVWQFLADVNQQARHWDPAIKARQQVLRIRRKRLGESDWRVRDAQLALAFTRRLSALTEAEHARLAETAKLHAHVIALSDQGDYDQAIKIAQGVTSTLKELLGDEHRHYATVLGVLATVYQKKGDYARALPLFQQALKIDEKAYGQHHPDYAKSLNNLGQLYALMRDYPRAEAAYLQMKRIVEDTLGKHHAFYAATLNNLGTLYVSMRQEARARPLFEQALKVWRTTVGERDPEYGQTLNNLALACQGLGDYDRAEQLLTEAMRIRGQTRGKGHPDYAQSVNNMAFICYMKGDYDRAATLYQQGIQTDERTLGKDHPAVAASLNNLATLYYSKGDAPRAESLLRRSMSIMRRHLTLTAAVQAERQQLQLARQARLVLHLWLSVAAAANVTPGEAYRHVFEWKGSVWQRQQERRQLRRVMHDAGDDEGLALFDELEQVTRQLANLLLKPDLRQPLAARTKQAEALTNHKERLEQQLETRSAAFRRVRQRAGRTVADLRKTLPAEPRTVLVDLLEYTHADKPKGGKGRPVAERRLMAFIVPPKGQEPVRQVPLGALAPIEQAIDAWRAAAGDEAEATKHAQVLDDLVWSKLKPHLGDAKVVLISPDGATSRFPFAALPGTKRGTYLIEDMAIATVPAPRLLAAMDEPNKPPTGPPSLMLVGDVDFGADAGRRMAAADRNGHWRAPAGMAPLGKPGDTTAVRWGRLEATGAEVDAIAGLFRGRFNKGALTILRGGAATESALRRSASGQHYLHLATHGYFALPGLRSALRQAARADAPGGGLFGRTDVGGWHPGLLSGIVLAGANRPADPNRDDGILTALEVQALDLTHIELVVLSACETGLGETAGGEGLLGLQRAFSLAGARRVVASLWKVNDNATAVLMRLFYKRLWRDGKTPIEALRDAQLFVLSHGDPDQLKQLASQRGPVFAKTVKRIRDERPTAPDKRPAPQLWAAFVLSGDWR